MLPESMRKIDRKFQAPGTNKGATSVFGQATSTFSAEHRVSIKLFDL